MILHHKHFFCSFLYFYFYFYFFTVSTSIFIYIYDIKYFYLSYFSSVTVWVDGGLKDLLSQEAEIKAIRGNEINYKSQILKEIITIDNEKKNIVTDMNMNDIWKKGIFTPKNKFKTYWDVFMSLLVVYTVITLPCQLAFDSYSTINNEILTLIDYIIISFFFVDIIINMNTAYYSETYNAYVLTRKLIIIKYLRSWFFIDFVAFFPFELVIMNLLSLSNDSIESSTKLHTLQLIKSIRILRIIKSVKYMKISKYINNMLDKTNISPVMSNIMYTLFNVAVVGHFLACIWWGISSRLTDTPWYDEKNYTYLNLRDSPFRIQYITSLYLSIATLTTTGYGDITPQNTSERILAILIFIVGALVYGYVTANVSTIIRNFTKNETRANKFSSQIREYLNCEEISGNVLREVTEHARKIHRRSSTFDEDLLLGRLPHHLKLGSSVIHYFNINLFTTTLIDLFIHSFAYLFIYSFIYLFVNLFIYLFAYLFIYLFTYLSIVV